MKEAKEEDSENESTEEAVLRKSASLSFERVSQEIEKASQEMPSARQAPPEQHARPDVPAAPDAAPRAEQSMFSASQQPLGQHAGSAGARHAHSSETHPAEQLKQRKSQRSPLKPLNRSGSLATQQATRASQDANQGPSQPIRCAGSELSTPSMSGASQLRVRKQDEQRQMPIGDRGQAQLPARGISLAGSGNAGHPASVRPPGLVSAHSAALHHTAARSTHHAHQRQPFADVQQQLLGRHAQLSSHAHGARPQLSQPVSQPPRPQSSALQQPHGLDGIYVNSSGSQQPNRTSSNYSRAQSTGVFAAKNSGIFADDDDGEEDADWDAGVAKLLESAALSRPPQQPSQPVAQVSSSQCHMVALHGSRKTLQMTACMLITCPPQALRCSVSEWQDARDECIVFTEDVTMLLHQASLQGTRSLAGMLCRNSPVSVGAQAPNFIILLTGQAMLSPAKAHSFSRYGPPKIWLSVCQL